MSWYECEAKSATRDVWVALRGEGRPQMGPWPLPDGRDVYDVVADGDVDQVPYTFWMERTTANRGKRYGDMLWTGGLSIKVMSHRMVDLLADLGATGYRTFPLEFRKFADGMADKYTGFATLPLSENTPEYDIQPLLDIQNYAFLINQRIRNALIEADMKVVIEPYDPTIYEDL